MLSYRFCTEKEKAEKRLRLDENTHTHTSNSRAKTFKPSTTGALNVTLRNQFSDKDKDSYISDSGTSKIF